MFFVDLAPQDWAFFTRNPETSELVPYATATGHSLARTPQARLSNLMGISRAQRAQGVELGIINSEVSHWTNCEASSAACLEDARRTPAQVVMNSDPSASLCGDVIVTVQETPKWSYRDVYVEKIRITKYARLMLRCAK